MAAGLSTATIGISTIDIDIIISPFQRTNERTNEIHDDLNRSINHQIG
jgi:hypothetical protein